MKKENQTKKRIFSSKNISSKKIIFSGVKKSKPKIRSANNFKISKTRLRIMKKFINNSEESFDSNYKYQNFYSNNDQYYTQYSWKTTMKSISNMFYNSNNNISNGINNNSNDEYIRKSFLM